MDADFDTAQLGVNLDKKRFCRLWNRCAGDAQPHDDYAVAIFAELSAFYGEPHRHYHTGGHINDCLSRMDLAATELGHSDDVELAIWFHDVIYAIGAADNERRSADWFADKASDVLAPELIRRVDDYIMSTTHREPPTDEEAMYVVDVDLSGLGMSPQSFWRDGDNIRKELAGQSDAEFITKQSGFLRCLLERERIYCTPFFYNLCEDAARRNIHAALERYAKGDCG